jgi:dihydrofolate synthase/folylpolyglutamate synthase
VGEADLRYRRALEWLHDRQGLGVTPGLQRVEALLASVGRPEKSFRTVHVGGTNGKGSVATLLAEGLRLSGRRTGLYTSPHLVEFGERIRVDGDPIAHGETADLTEHLRAVIETLDRNGRPPTYFEICTALAFMHFERRGVSWAVVEAGMGGASDATNVVMPELAIITNVGLDHTAFLGDELGLIALEKSGIVKRGVPIVTAARGEALAVIEREAETRNAEVIVVGRDYLPEIAETGELSISHRGEVRRYRVALEGRHQMENATLVVAGCDVLRRESVDIAEPEVRRALAATTVPGRLETMQRDGVTVTVDGAHNREAVEAVADHLSETGETYDLIVGFSRDKDWPAMLDRLVGLAGRVWGVPIRSPRSVDPDEIKSALPPNVPFETAEGFEQAFERALTGGSKRVLVTGSLFLAGEAIATLTDRDLSEVGGSQ